MHRFFQEELSTGVLSEEESQHAAKVLRLNIGDEIEVFDGRGSFILTSVSEVSKKSVGFLNVSPKKGWDADLILPSIAIAPTKNISRFEWYLEKATEIGVQNIYPIFSARSERKNLKLERLHKIILAATKQSKRTVMPEIFEPIRFSEFVKTTSLNEKFIAHCLDDEKGNYLNINPQKNNTTLIAIGPEGDFTPEEIQLALHHNFKPISFGEARLRTETAGIFACMLFQNR